MYDRTWFPASTLQPMTDPILSAVISLEPAALHLPELVYKYTTNFYYDNTKKVRPFFQQKI
jgi:hypothetical protein